jgi:hypothetical protein
MRREGKRTIAYLAELFVQVRCPCIRRRVRLFVVHFFILRARRPVIHSPAQSSEPYRADEIRLDEFDEINGDLQRDRNEIVEQNEER